jgi:hypothetical protein
MRSLLLFPVITLLILSSGFSGKQFEKRNYFSEAPKTIGVYDHDSVLNAMPSYRQALVEDSSYRKMNEQQLASIKNEFSRKQYEFNRDSSLWDSLPLIKELKRKEIADLKVNMGLFIQQIDEDAEMHKKGLLDPLNQKIVATANDLAKKKKYYAIVNKTELPGYLVMYPNAKVINVTAEITTKLGI